MKAYINLIKLSLNLIFLVIHYNLNNIIIYVPTKTKIKINLRSKLSLKECIYDEVTDHDWLLNISIYRLCNCSVRVK